MTSTWPSKRPPWSADLYTMTTLPAWTDAEWNAQIAEPFRSDRGFWTSLEASADAFVTVVVAIAAAVVLVLVGDTTWSAAPFLVPSCLAVRAAVVGRSSSRRSRESFPDERAWREAERGAVAATFGRALRRPRFTR
jgi:hypothetical protein